LDQIIWLYIRKIRNKIQFNIGDKITLFDRTTYQLLFFM